MAKIVPAKGNILEKWIPSRYVLAILGCIGLGIIYGLKVNLSVAIVSMVNHTAIDILSKNNSEHVAASSPNYDHQEDLEEDGCFDESNSTGTSEGGPFVWTGHMQGPILSSYFWGYIVAQLPGGYIAERFSAKWVMVFSVAINIVCTLLTPMMANLHYGGMIAMRIGEGIGGGVTFPAMHVMLANWSPPNERSVISGITYAGTALGTVLSMLLSGAFASQWGWESIFYIMGAASTLWLVLWVIFIEDTPEQQWFISQSERDQIVNSLKQDDETKNGGEPKQRPPFPLCSVLKSMPFYAILVAHVCGNWGWYMVLIELPSYMKMVLKFKIAENAVLTSIPFFLMWVFTLVLSKTLDNMRVKNMISTTTARKIATIISSLIPMCCLIGLCYIGCMKGVAVTLMTIAVMSCGGFFCGYFSNHIDIAPNYAGTLMAITNTFATISGIIVPIFVGNITDKDPSITSWRLIFWVTIVLYGVVFVFYTMFGSGEEQPWNKGEESKKDIVEAQPLKMEEKNYNATSNV